MSEKTEKPKVADVPPPSMRGPETQGQRWIKYGGNVILVSVVVVLLAVGLTWIATKHRLRRDTSSNAQNELKPQTKAVLRDLKQSVKIVALYAKPDTDARRDEEEERARKLAEEKFTRVADLLDEYKSNGGGRIEVEVIDPDRQKSKVDALIDDVTTKYGGEVKKYQAFLDDYKKTKFESLKKQVTQAIALAPAAPFAAENMPEGIRLINQSVEQISADLDKQREEFDEFLKKSPPDYKGATDSISRGMSELAEVTGAIAQQFAGAKGDTKLNESLRKYLTDAAPKFQEIKKSADDIKAEIGKLGELKLDDLRRKLGERNAILVMGPKNMEPLSDRDVWPFDQNVRRAISTTGGQLKPQFAGEQQITSAILSLTAEKKPMVAFVRGGGPPLAQAASPFTGPGGPLSRLAGRLRSYNFDVVEKDLSGMWAVQQQMQQRQQMPPAPEPSDEEIKDAIWVVVSIPSAPTPMGNADISSKLSAHLNNGGSAMVLVEPEADGLAGALAPWGVTVRANAMILHEMVETSGAEATGNWINQARRRPEIFITNAYGSDHLIVRPIAGLDFLAVGPSPVEYSPQKGYTGTSLLPIPTPLKTWGETSLSNSTQDVPTYDPKADLAPPFHIAAAVQKEGGGRLVVLGSAQVMINQILSIPDIDLIQQYGIMASRFPGNAEFATNSVLWLAKMEPMIAISPAATEVSRIGDVSPGALKTWRVILMAGLPLAVVAAGLVMFVRRRG